MIYIILSVTLIVILLLSAGECFGGRDEKANKNKQFDGCFGEKKVLKILFIKKRRINLYKIFSIYFNRLFVSNSCFIVSKCVKNNYKSVLVIVDEN